MSDIGQGIATAIVLMLLMAFAAGCIVVGIIWAIAHYLPF